MLEEKYGCLQLNCKIHLNMVLKIAFKYDLHRKCAMGTVCGHMVIFLDLFLLSMEFYILHFTSFIFKCIFTTKNIEVQIILNERVPSGKIKFFF